MPNLQDQLGLGRSYDSTDPHTQRYFDYINLKLAARGFAIVGEEKDFPFLEMGRSLLANFQEKLRLLADHLCPADQRIDSFLRDYLSDVPAAALDRNSPLVPSSALVLEKHGISRLLSLPPDRDSFESEIVSSFRAAQGVIHNPARDRRTTAGVFHVSEGGLPVPGDKLAVPKETFARLLQHALNPPADLLTIPFTATQERPARAFVSLLLRPVIRPEVPGLCQELSMEVRFFAPGNLVSNLDFVESIFGNAGDPHLPENDSALDPDHWSGHTGCVILAPHLVKLRKKDLGLPHVSSASEVQRRDGMCWNDESELYNNGGAFKITCRDHRGVIVTLIADNYFGYCKKEVKTQISYATNLSGGGEEEHAGGAIAFASFDHGAHFSLNRKITQLDHTFDDVVEILGDTIDVRPEGYAIDKKFANIYYVPETAEVDLDQQKVSWQTDVGHALRLQPGITYVYPSGYKVQMIQPTSGQSWRIIGTQAEGTFCHKPCTVSGGGKSEISKALQDAMRVAPVIVPEFQATMNKVKELIDRNYWDRFPNPRIRPEQSRPLLDPRRSLGSALRLLTPDEGFTDAHNDYVRSLSRHVIDMVLLVKRYYREDWGSWDEWRNRFTVDVVDGQPGFEIKYRNQHIVARYLRVGFAADGLWRMFSLRKDFLPATKLQREDDITASTTVPVPRDSGMHPDLPEGSYKFALNCEYRFFQRPDEAIHRGYDKNTELEFSLPGNFFSNYEPVTRAQAKEMIADAIRFGRFTLPMQRLIREFARAAKPEFIAVSSSPRLVEGKPSENPRYLQTRPDLLAGRPEYLAKVGMHLYRGVPVTRPVLVPVNAILPGRRNNPPDVKKGIRALAVYNPVHYQQLPELFMDLTSSLTGKSPSTTGAGSEGALTKSPFNALLPITDLNNALISSVLTRQPCFTTAAGYIGPKFRVDHDISLLIPEVWCRMHIHERNPETLLEQELLEPIEDFEHNGQKVLASRLGYRITEKFVHRFFGRVFADPGALFTEEMLRPELQDLDAYVDGINNIVEAQQRVAKFYFQDGSIEFACPPMRALLHIMAHGEYEGMDVRHPDIRQLFDVDTILKSDWYAARLEAQARIDSTLWRRHIENLSAFQEKENYRDEIRRLNIAARLRAAKKRLKDIERPGYAASLIGHLGADPIMVGK
ncbi:MAG: hypothetical protein O3C21_07675 [Verrucomicrobia bacterium]|nr:hypothetical protein [Verrucomicrobiota bacterium]